MSEERRGFTFEGTTHWITLTDLQRRLSGAPTKHILAEWDLGKRE